MQLALSRFSTSFTTDQGLTFAGMAIALLPPLLLFLVLQRSFIQGLTAGAATPLRMQRQNALVPGPFWTVEGAVWFVLEGGNRVDSASRRPARMQDLPIR